MVAAPAAMTALPDGNFAAAIDNNRIIFFSREGKRLAGDLVFPEELAAAHADHGRLLVADASGMVYLVEDHKIVGKFQLPDFRWETKFGPRLFSDGKVLAAGAGSNVFLLETDK